MCCGVLKDELIVRIEPSDFDALVAQPHVRPFDFLVGKCKAWSTSMGVA